MPNQSLVWMVSQLVPDMPLYNDRFLVRIPPGVDEETMADAMDRVVAEQEALRIVVEVVNGEPRQRALPPSPGALQVIDAAPEPGEDGDAAAVRVANELADRPFDLAAGPLARFALIRAGERRFLTVCVHHLVCDAYGLSIIVKRAVEGGPGPETSFLDYVEWQQGRLEHGFGAELDYWGRTLAGVGPNLELPADRPRLLVPDFRGGHHLLSLDAELSERVAAAARTAGTTPFAVLLTAFYELLARVSGRRDLVVGTTMLSRPVRETHEVVGMFADMVPLRLLRDDPLTFAQALTRVREVVAGAFAHQDIPFANLVERLNLPRAANAPALFSILFNMPGLTFAVGDELLPLSYSTRGTQFDLIFNVLEQAGRFELDVQYSDVFEPETIARWSGWWESLLRQGLDRPDVPLRELDMLGSRVRLRLAQAGHRPEAETPAESLWEPVARHAAAAPGTPAFRGLTYGELFARVRRLAAALRARGVGPGTRVVTLLPGGADFVAAALAVWMRGATLVPLDPRHPSARTERAARAVDPSVAVDPGLFLELLGSVPDGAADPSPPAAPYAPEAAAAIMFTSGSTGTPKGVVLSYGALGGHAAQMARLWELGPADRVLQYASPAFDTSLEQILVALTAGAALVAREGNPWLPATAWRVIADECVTVANLPTALVHQMAEEEVPDGLHLRLFMPGGEALSSGMAERLRAALPDGCALWNMYGPTEGVVTALAHVLDGTARGPVVPIGRPLPGRRVALLDGDLRPVPPGGIGEICLGGPMLAQGYLDAPVPTGRGFVPDPDGPPGSRLYRTGDLGRWTFDWILEFRGRRDRQVKVSGVRVEPEEVEAALTSLDGVAEAAVTARRVEDQTLLHAYLVAEGPQPDGDRARRRATATVWEALSALLPPALMPATLTFLQALPTGPTGKIDHAALPAPPARSAAPARPVDEVATAMTRAMSETLGVPVGTNDDFFALGGTSLSAMRVLAAVRASTGCDLTLPDLYTARTPAALARLSRRTREAVPLATAPVAEPVPATSAQRRLWTLEKLAEDVALYTVPAIVEVARPLALAATAQAWDWLLRRHDVLRAAFKLTAEGLFLRPGTAGERPTLTDLSKVPEHEARARCEQIVAADMARPFDLESGPLARLRLVTLGEDRTLLVLTAHHTVCDGWSVRILVDELLAAEHAFRRGTQPVLPPPGPSFADVAAWAAARPADPDALTEWRAILEGVPLALDLPLDRPRSPKPGFRAAALPLTLDAELTARLDETARLLGVTAFTLILAAWQVTLAQWTGQDDFVVGVPYHGRDVPGVEHTVGMFVETLPVPARVHPGDTVSSLLRATFAQVIRCIVNADVTFEAIVGDVRGRAGLARDSLVQVLLAYQDEDNGAGAETDRRMLAVPTGSLDLDLILNLERDGPVIRGGVEYRAELFEAATIGRVTAHYLTVLGALAAEPHRLVRDLPPLPAAPSPLAETHGGETTEREERAVEDAVEQVVASVWREALDAPPDLELDLDADFFELGGDSFAATRVTLRLAELLDMFVPVRGVFANPTIAALADLLRRLEPERTELAAAALVEMVRAAGEEPAQLGGDQP
ncbi:amino acid adenylation domain-containing protein [Sphaerisporangium viridialbum]|uniref:amino acid adenylation domain-containing protein n=1 Tax=Sphaerisporangium viridialbum TaxID=46189 RepID=UPI003C70E7B1